MKCDLTFERAFILQGNTMLLNVNKEEEKNDWQIKHKKYTTFFFNIPTCKARICY